MTGLTGRGGSLLIASVAVFDEVGGEAATEGELRVTPGDDPGTLALSLDGAGVVIHDREAFIAALAVL